METKLSTSQARTLAWEACLNTRELGGYPVQNGGQTGWGRLVRSDTTFLLTLAGQRALTDYGVRTVIDLRFPSELIMNPSPFSLAFTRSQDGRPDYVHIPLDRDQDLTWPSQASPAEIMSDMYCRMLELNRKHVASVLNAIAHARPGGVLFHCHAGKDRTGLIAAVLLAALGVPKEIIAQDYALTNPSLEHKRETTLSDPSLSPDRRRYLSVLTSAHPDTILLTLAYLDQHYGSAAGYLQTTPLPPDDLYLLKKRLVENERGEQGPQP
jgi:protein-tyrosine phosphatase